MEPLVLVGGGGHCRAVIDVLEKCSWPIAGLIDHGPTKTTEEYPFLGNDEQLSGLKEVYSQALVTVGQIKSAETRRRLFGRLKELGYTLPAPISPLAHFSAKALIGEGSIVMHMAIVNSGARIGRNVIINNRVLVEHDAQIGDHCHAATGAIINGGVEIGQGVFLGSGSICREGVKIGDGCLIGLGVKVLHDLDPGTIFLGGK